MQLASVTDKILSIDIGGTLVKATILNYYGELQTEYKKVETPKPCTPQLLVDTIRELVADFHAFDKVSVGFPGYVRDGVVITCPQLGTDIFTGFDLCSKLKEELACPVRVINDADMQGLGVATGKGFEVVITLGTGLGSALLKNGNLLPHLELSQHPFTERETYDFYVGAIALEQIGVEQWNERVRKMLKVFKTVFNYDHLYIGGGNANKINFPLERNMTLVSNKDGIKGGAKLWQHEAELSLETTSDEKAASEPAQTQAVVE
ncbi:MAG: ROK family protein [Williamsia sp.]|nr:ROK family protein [Williamsia sp.]